MTIAPPTSKLVPVPRLRLPTNGPQTTSLGIPTTTMKAVQLPARPQEPRSPVPTSRKRPALVLLVQELALLRTTITTMLAPKTTSPTITVLLLAIAMVLTSRTPILGNALLAPTPIPTDVLITTIISPNELSTAIGPTAKPTTKATTTRPRQPIGTPAKPRTMPPNDGSERL